MPGIMLRGVIRSAAKAAAQYRARSIRRSSKNNMRRCSTWRRWP